MSKLIRVFQKIFASTAPSTEVGQFGSFASGSPLTSNDPATVQALANFGAGWFAAIEGDNSPAVEDMNGIFFLAFRQLAYVFQAGIPEWDSQTIYYKGSLATSGGVVFSSLSDVNVGNALTDTVNWKVLGRRVRTVFGTDTATSDDDILRLDATAASFSETLPTAVGAIGKTFTVKRLNTNTNVPTIQANGAELIDGANTYPMATPFDSVTLLSNGAGWDII